MVLAGVKVQTLLVTSCWLPNSGTLKLAFDRVAARREDTKYRFVQNIFTECLIHRACCEIAYVCAYSALDTVKNIRRFCLQRSVLALNPDAQVKAAAPPKAMTSDLEPLVSRGSLKEARRRKLLRNFIGQATGKNIIRNVC